MTLGEHCGMRDLIPKLPGSYLIVVSVCGIIAETTTIAGLDKFMQANDKQDQLPYSFKKARENHGGEGGEDGRERRQKRDGDERVMVTKAAKAKPYCKTTK